MEQNVNILYKKIDPKLTTEWNSRTPNDLKLRGAQVTSL